MTWYEQWFSRDEYDIVYQKRNDKEATAVVDLIENLVQPVSASSILDVGCGRGRHAVVFARRGYKVTGLDLSERSLDRARRRARSEDLEITFVHGDMRVPIADSTFDGVVNLFTAFGYFEAWKDHQKAVDAMASALKPGGFLVQDFLNPAYVEAGLVPSDTRTVGEVEIKQNRWIDEGRILKEIIFSGNEGTHAFFESVALLGRPDFERLYESAGLDIFDIRGDYGGAPHTDESPRMILFSRAKSK